MSGTGAAELNDVFRPFIGFLEAIENKIEIGDLPCWVVLPIPEWVACGACQGIAPVQQGAEAIGPSWAVLSRSIVKVADQLSVPFGRDADQISRPAGSSSCCSLYPAPSLFVTSGCFVIWANAEPDAATPPSIAAANPDAPSAPAEQHVRSLLFRIRSPFL